MYDNETDPYGNYYIYIFNTRSFMLAAGIKMHSLLIYREYYCHKSDGNKNIGSDFLNN